MGRDGAAVIIAGIAEEDARVAARFASSQSVPVVLIVRPPDVRAVHIGPTPAPAAADEQNTQLVFSFSLNVSPDGFKPLADSRFTDWTNAFGTKPTFWAAAGRDAAVIALQSVKDLPEATTEDVAEVKNRRNTVRAALNIPVTETLWSPPLSAGAPPSSEK
ncbi:MAG: hypothetical protein IPK82_26175 [Polyangiaceae bacterium]|nr:hypothetical protein [Polyangiaceae bacterium]